MVSVPKRNFKRAVKRNLLKRRIREAWRLNAGILEGTAGDAATPSGRPRYDLLFVYLGREIESYERIEATLTGLLRQLADQPSGK
jgi:ribonuclease P protein component